MFEERKNELRERLRRSQLVRTYPLRSNAKFTDENDHNPLVLASCPKCGGVGTIGIAGPPGVEIDDTCDACRGIGISFEVEPYFADTPSDLIDVRPNSFSWLECPKCRKRFLPSDRGVWSGLRHLPCGQKIRIIDA